MSNHGSTCTPCCEPLDDRGWSRPEASQELAQIPQERHSREYAYERFPYTWWLLKPLTPDAYPLSPTYSREKVGHYWRSPLPSREMPREVPALTTLRISSSPAMTVSCNYHRKDKHPSCRAKTWSWMTWRPSSFPMMSLMLGREWLSTSMDIRNQGV